MNDSRARIAIRFRFSVRNDQVTMFGSQVVCWKRVQPACQHHRSRTQPAPRRRQGRSMPDHVFLGADSLPHPLPQRNTLGAPGASPPNMRALALVLITALVAGVSSPSAPAEGVAESARPGEVRFPSQPTDLPPSPADTMSAYRTVDTWV